LRDWPQEAYGKIKRPGNAAGAAADADARNPIAVKTKENHDHPSITIAGGLLLFHLLFLEHEKLRANQQTKVHKRKAAKS
jgi:hypothetical protein